MSFSLFDFNLYGLIFAFSNKKIWVKMPHAKKLLRHAVFICPQPALEII